MKIASLEIKNVGLIEHELIEFNTPLNLFFGDIRQGKTTILNAVKWVLGAPWPDDLIRHGQEEAEVILTLDCGMVSRSWYRSKSGEIKAREITLILNGRPVAKPATEIARFLNPFLLDQNFLIRMGETERKKYFAELFAVDTTDLDTEMFKAEREAQTLRAEIKGYGIIDLTPVPESNTEVLRAKLEALRGSHAALPRKLGEEIEALRKQHQAECDKVDAENQETREYNARRQSVLSGLEMAKLTVRDLETQMASLQKRLDEAKERVTGAEKAVAENPIRELKQRPEPPKEIAELTGRMMSHPVTTPEIKAVEDALSQAAANDARREQLKKNQDRAAEKAGKEARLSTVESKVKEMRQSKIKRLADISANSKIKDLAFLEDGTFSYQGTQAGMLSTSQLMTLSSELSGLYPPGFGLELIDRGESLGKSIYDFIEKAKRDNSTILATIVGEDPAKAPDEVGVFVVAAGKITRKPKAKKQEELI